MAAKITLMVNVTDSDGKPAGAKRIAAALPQVGKMISGGSLAGQFEQWIHYTVGGEADQSRELVHFEVRTFEPETGGGK